MTIWCFWISDCFVISLSICYWLFKCGVLRKVCERESQLQRRVCVCLYVCVCSRLWERDTWSHNRGLCVNTYELHYRVCHATLFPFQAWTDGKTKDIINCLYFSFESWSSRLWKGSYISDAACGVQANHNALWSWRNPTLHVFDVFLIWHTFEVLKFLQMRW